MLRIKQVAVVIFGTSLIAVTPADAGWRYTDWGTTPADVVESSDGKAMLLDEPVTTPKGLIKMARARYVSGDLDFVVSFYFSPELQLLDLVALRLRDNTAANQLYQAMITLYGEPDEETIKNITEGVSHTAKWKDESANNIVIYFGIGNFFVIQYAPLNRSPGGQ